MTYAQTYTYAYARAQAVVDQVDVLLAKAGIGESARQKVCHGVNQQWLEAVGVYLTRDGLRVYEVEAKINWPAHAQAAELTISTALPGWEANGSPEVVVIGNRIAAVAKDNGLDVRYWVLFTESIRNDPARHKQLCPQVGVSHGTSPADWKSTPNEKAVRLQDLREVGMSVRSAL